MKNNVFLKTLLLVSLACIVGSSNAQTISEGTTTISRTFYKNDGTPLEGVKVTVTKVVKNGRIISLGPVTYLSNASGVVSITVPQGSTVYMEIPGFNTSGGVPVNTPASSGWTYASDATKSPTGNVKIFSVNYDSLIVQRNDVTLGTKHTTIDFSTTFNATESPTAEANISINHDSLKARPGSKLTYLHDLFVDRALSAHDETSLANAHTKALDSNFVLLVPPDYSAAAMTFTNRDTALKLINYATINITASDTIPAGANIVMAGKGRFNISSGVTLTFASGSRFDGGLQRRFIGSGTVKFQEDVVSEVFPQWWGAIGDSSTQCVAAFQSAVNSGVKRITVKVPDGDYLFNDNLTIPSNVSLTGKGRFNISSSKTLTFASGSRFDGGLQRRFIGAGVVKFAEGSIEAVYPEWWGAVADSSTQSVTAIQNAINSGVGRNRVIFSPGVYKINDHLELQSNVDLIGQNTCITSSDTNDYFIHGGPVIKNILIDGLTLRQSPKAHVVQPNISAIYIIECDSLTIRNCRILNATGMGMQFPAVRNVMIRDNRVENTLRDGIHISNGDNFDRGRTIYSENVTIIGNHVKNAGDDGIACVSYKRQAGFYASAYGTWTGAQQINRNVTISNNIIEEHGSTLGRGISVLGGRHIKVIGNTVRGSSNQTMSSGIIVSRASTFDGFRNEDVTVTGNTVVNAQFTSFVSPTYDNYAGVFVYGSDTVKVDNNYIDWSPYLLGIRVRADTVGERRGWSNVVESLSILDNDIINSRLGISMLSTQYVNGHAWHSNITIQNNRIINSRRSAVTADSITNLIIADNRILGVNKSHIASIYAVDLDSLDGDIIVKNNYFRSASPDTVRYVVSIRDVRNQADVRELGNVYNAALSAASVAANTNFNTITSSKRLSQDSKRIHYATGVPTTGTWEKGDITINKDPDSGENSEWICTVSGTPGTWVQSTSTINGIGLNDTTAFTLDGSGAATVTGISNIILDTQTAAGNHTSLDTVVTLTGRIGQIIYVSPRANGRSLVFQDGTKFRLGQTNVRLDSTHDVAQFKATTATSWKLVSLKTRKGLRGSNSFSGTAANDTVTVAGGLATDLYFVTLTGTSAPSANDAFRVEALNGGFAVHRSASGTSGLTYVWRRERP